MENSYHHRDFEHFLKENADQYRMFPSEKVWKNIHYNLHQRNRWQGIGLAVLLLATVSVTWVMLIPSNRNQQIADRLPARSTPISIPAVAIPLKSAPIAAYAQPASHLPADKAAGGYSQSGQSLFMNETEQNLDERVDVEIAKTLAPPSLSLIRPVAQPVLVQKIVVPDVPVIRPVQTRVAATEPSEPMNEAGKPTPPVVTTIVDEEKPFTPSNTAPAEVKQSETVKLGFDDYDAPLTIESVVNSYRRKKSRVTLEAYFTPTVSYRRLHEDNQFLSETNARSTPGNATVTISDVENIVTHKPDFGLQIGVNAGYDISPRLTLTAGLQFNVSKYDIRAYSYPSENTTIALMSGPYFSPSSLETQTTYRNYSAGTDPNWLHNLYFSASVPVGLQVRLSAPGQNLVGIAGSIQPTYILGNRTYLISTDYKNYAQVPSLIRRWNMSTSLEIFTGLSTGRIDWRIGPLARYQLMSSFKKEYPVKEHLFDFGLKVGIMLKQ